MKKDAFIGTMRYVMQKYGKAYSDLVNPLSERIFFYIEHGDSIVDAFNKAMRDVDFYKLNKKAIEDAVYESALRGYGIKAPDVYAGVEGADKKVLHSLTNVSWTADNVKLSERLHGVSVVMHNNIKSSVGMSLRSYKTIKQTAMKLYDGYDTADNILRQADLPKYLRKIQNLTKNLYAGDRNAARNSELYKKVTKDIRKLKTPALRAAYNQALEASSTDKPRALAKAKKLLETGNKEAFNKLLAEEREKALKKALWVATQEKTRYHAERIARTESARAYYEGQMAEAERDPDIWGFKWVLSTAHVHGNSDCDCYDNSMADMGYGRGVYPKNDVPELPAHPNCMCHLEKIYEWEVKPSKGK